MNNLSNSSLIDSLNKECENLNDIYDLVLLESKINNILAREEQHIILALEAELERKYLNAEGNYIKAAKISKPFYYTCYGLCVFIAFHFYESLPEHIEISIATIPLFTSFIYYRYLNHLLDTSFKWEMILQAVIKYKN